MIARECLATRMRRLNRVISGIYDRSFGAVGVTASQMGILVVLAQADGSKPAEVCQALQMDKSTLCRNVQRMQRQGWVATVATDDARSHRLEVTDLGRGLIERALPLWRRAQAQARDVLGSAVVDQLFEAVDAPFSQDPLGIRTITVRKAEPGKRATSSMSHGEAGALTSSGSAVRATGQPAEGKGIFFWE